MLQIITFPSLKGHNKRKRMTEARKKVQLSKLVNKSRTLVLEQERQLKIQNQQEIFLT